ncbi:MAG: hypothetical protein NTW37_13000 [Proteobacteria bacterium]|nr:hypothetical protein [Pseudomonadota bacterium]
MLIAYMFADLYLAAKGWGGVVPDGREPAHLRMRNLLLWIGLPVMFALGFAVGWLSHVPSQSQPRAESGADGPGGA